jgi:hypothetical protein
MKLKITVAFESPTELQVIENALNIYADHLAAADRVPIIGRNNLHALELVRELQSNLGLATKRQPSEYTPVHQPELFTEEQE